MTTLAERAHANAERAKAAQNAASVPKPFSPRRSSWWRVCKADGTVDDVCVHPPLSRAEVRSTFYPDAKSLLLPDEA